MKSHLAKICIYSAIICLILAVLCLCYRPTVTFLTNGYTPKITQSRILKDKNKKATSYNMSKVKSASLSQIIDARLHANQVSVLGQILVPSVSIHLPINKGISNNSLLLGAGTMKPRQKMGRSNYALAGHHMINKSALFTPLWLYAHKGTKVYLTDMKNIYVYKINVRKIISPYDTKVINNTKKPILTLITCNNSGSKRLLLQGKLSKKLSMKNAPKKLVEYSKSKTNNHQVLKGY